MVLLLLLHRSSDLWIFPAVRGYVRVTQWRLSEGICPGGSKDPFRPSVLHVGGKESFGDVLKL